MRIPIVVALRCVFDCSQGYNLPFSVAGLQVTVNGKRCLNLATFNFLGLLGEQGITVSRCGDLRRKIASLHDGTSTSCRIRRRNPFRNMVSAHVVREASMAPLVCAYVYMRECGVWDVVFVGVYV